MKHKTFGEFVDRKKRESIKQLKLIKKILESKGMDVESFLETEEDDNYIFCSNPSKSGSVGGIRIYKIGDQICFRVQRENKTHPYGTAYSIPIEEMFHDFLGEKSDEIKAGKRVIEAVDKEIRSFFSKSEKADREYRRDGGGEVVVKAGGMLNLN